MYSTGKIVLGLGIFAALFTYPFWNNVGGAAYKGPELQKPANEKECIESTEWMRANHMNMLDDWRSAVVRDGKRVYTNHAGKQFEMSLQKTCMSCHTSKQEFCDKCHTAMAVTPFCWDCHVPPKEKEGAK